MNPRGSFVDDIFDEFSSDQRLPIDIYNQSGGSSSTFSLLSSHHSIAPSSNHSISQSSSSMNFTSAFSLFTTKTEDEQLQAVLKRISKIFHEYQKIHESLLARGLYPSDKVPNKTKSNASLQACFREVPELFFRPEFSLQNIEMFNQAIGAAFPPASQISQNKKKQYPIIQQEKLSKYLDVVELALLNNIWIRSSSFFRVLDDIRVLQTLVSQGYNFVTSLRSKYQKFSERMALTVLRIPKLHIRSGNQNKLFDKLQLIQKVITGRSMVKSMVEIEDFLAALDIIQELKTIYHNELEGVIALRKIGKDLDEYDGFINEVMWNKFVSLAIQWDDHLSHPSPALINGNIHDDLIHDQDFLGITQQLSNEENLSQLIDALITVNKFKDAINLYKSRLSDSLRLIIRTCVLEYLTSFDPSLISDAIESYDSSSSNSTQQDTPFAQRVKEMSTENFLSCLSMCFEHSLIALTKAYNLHLFIEGRLQGDINKNETSTSSTNTTASVNSSSSIVVNASASLVSSSSASANATTMVLIDSSHSTQSILQLSKSCLTTACELTQKSISQLLNLRKDSNVRMPVDKMKVLWLNSLKFISTIEKSTNVTAYILRQNIHTQSKQFIDHLHESYKGKLVNTLDNERWVQCDVSTERQHEVTKLVSGKTLLSSLSMTSTSSVSVTSSPSTNNDSLNIKVKKESRPVFIDELNKYHVVWSVLCLVDIILVYLELSIIYQPILTELIPKIIELIRLFDHRTRQLVLGAQSIQSAARLKSISARHLAITAQSINFLASLLSSIRAALLSQLPPKQHLLLTEFDRVAYELQDHHSALVAKFVSIVSDFIDAFSSKLKNVDWDKTTSSGTCEYFEEVLRNVTALHRVLIQLLPNEQLQDIFSRIFLLLNRKIPAHFEEIMPLTSVGKQRILDDVSYLVTSFSRLKQIDCKQETLQLEDIFKRKYLNKDITSVSNDSTSGSS